MSAISIIVDIPTDVILTENQRLHWAEKSAQVKTIRILAAYAKRQHFPRLTMPAACCVYTIWHAPKVRRRDAHNWTPTAKACLDGFVGGPSIRKTAWEYALLPDDSDKYLTGPDMRSSPHRSTVPGRTRFVFDFTERDPL